MKRYKDFFYEREEDEDDDSYDRRDGKRKKKSWKQSQRDKLTNRYKEDREED